MTEGWEGRMTLVQRLFNFKTSILAGSLAFFCIAQAQDLPSVEKNLTETAPTPTPAPAASPTPESVIENFCRRVDEQYSRYGWENSQCRRIPWIFSQTSEKNYPLVYWVLESGAPSKEGRPFEDTTLFLGGVHGDEPSGVYVLFKFANELLSNPELADHHRVIIAPLVNPDGFFARTRNNSRGVDLNRNFPTKDFNKSALIVWKKRRKGNPQHFPGDTSGSEAGTQFQMKLLDAFEPDKIFSLHSPLDFVDYDGPGSTKRKSALSTGEYRAQQIAQIFAKKTRNYRVVSYQFFPGSLGNYAGNERNIPTITLEFSSSNPKAANKHWADVVNALRAGVNYEFKRVTLAKTESKKTK